MTAGRHQRAAPDRQIGFNRVLPEKLALVKEQRVEGNRFRERHTDDALNENRGSSTWVTTDRLHSLRSNECYTKSSSKAAQSSGQTGTEIT